MNFKDDLAADIGETFLDVDEGFAVFATVTGGGSVAGIFFDPYYQAGAGVSIGVASSEPVFKIAAVDATGLDQGAGLVIDGTNYRVVEPQPDGAGVVDLRLQLV